MGAQAYLGNPDVLGKNHVIKLYTIGIRFISSYMWGKLPAKSTQIPAKSTQITAKVRKSGFLNFLKIRVP